MACSDSWKFVVWERMNKVGKWCPYSPEISQLLELNLMKNSDTVPLGDADENLRIYTVHLKELTQVSANTGTKSKVRRRLCDCLDTFCSGITWQWKDDHDVWHIYDVDVNVAIEKAFLEGSKSVTLNKAFRGYHYEIDFKKMLQINKQTKRKRKIQRKQTSSPYPVTKNPLDLTNQSFAPTCPPAIDQTPSVPTPEQSKIDFSDLAKEVPGTTDLEQQANSYIENVKRTYTTSNLNDGSGTVDQENNVDMNIDNDRKNSDDPPTPSKNSSPTIPSNSYDMVALVNGSPWYGSKPPHTSQSHIKPVPGIDPLPASSKKPTRKKKKMRKVAVPETDFRSVFDEHSNSIEKDSLINSDEDQVCIICYESLQNGSSYDDDGTLLQLKLCLHVFHKSCLIAMYNSGPKDNCLQCPLCKKIHGEKCGFQPPGKMVFHVLPYSLPGFYECDTIRIIYDIPSGTQGPEHPNPGKRYSSRGFPRHCFLPDNEMGRKVLRLLIKAWNRRLIFTIGQSSTTGEEDTVTWNEIHHKTEFGFNKRGHGYPDPNYFDNVLAELEAHGIKDEVYLWFPA